LTAVSGDDPLAFATAFYSPDHPVYRRPFQYQYTWGLPRRTTLDKGWAAICFLGNRECADWMASVTAIAPQFQQSTFTVTPTLWSQPGSPATIVALMVPPLQIPAGDDGTMPGAGIEDFSTRQRRN
jgi:hypothetical protein